jgi:hypothetical protein
VPVLIQVIRRGHYARIGLVPHSKSSREGITDTDSRRRRS